MCGRYAMGAAHLAFLNDLQGQYARLFPGRPLPRAGDEDDDDDGGGPLRLRGGGPGDDVACQCGLKWERERDFWPSYNIAPRQRAPVVRRDPETGQAMIETMQWGLIPHWTKHPPTGPLNTINARSEALIDASSGGMWHALKGYKRCAIPAQGYYEWQKKGSTKVAHFARLPLPPGGEASEPPILFFAGLWDTVKYVDPVPSKFVPGPDDDREPYPTGNPVPLSTFTIITTVPAPDIAWLHDRMPCILASEEDVARWIDLGEEPKGWKEGKGGTADLLVSFKGLSAYPVVPEVGKIGKSDGSYILPVAERKDGIKSFFMKQSPKKAPDAKAGPMPPSPLQSKGKAAGPGVKEEAKPSVKEEKASATDETKPEVKEEEKPDVKKESKGRKDEAKPSVHVTKPTTRQTRSSAKHEENSAPNDDREVKDPPADPVDPTSDRKAAEGDAEAEVIDVEGDDEPPSSQSQPSSQAGKRKRGGEEVKRGGRQTKVVRPAPREEEGQKPITSFFKSPKK